MQREYIIVSKWGIKHTERRVIFRYDVVPWTGKRVRHVGSWLRHPHTTNEIRQNKNCHWARPRRKHLPTAWDDKARHIDKNWKRHRETQYHNIVDM
jgi:hypothetical protein